MMKKLLSRGAAPAAKEGLTEEQQIELATELSLEDAMAAALRDSTETPSREVVPEELPRPVPLPHLTAKDEEDEEESPLAHLPKPEGTAEQREEWRRCLCDGPTILEAREMGYKDLIALLSISQRNVLLSKRQVTELHDHATITGRIIILPEGFVLHLLHKVVKLQRKLAKVKSENGYLRGEVDRLLEEAKGLAAKVRELENLMTVKDDEIKVLKKETKRLNHIVEQLLATLAKAEERDKAEEERIRELERENQHLKDKMREEADRAKEYRALLEQSRKENEAIRRAYERRRDEVVSILMKPLPSHHGLHEDIPNA